MNVLNIEPKVIMVDNYFSEAECDFVVKSNPLFGHSTGFNFKTQKSEKTDYRTSSTYYDTSLNFFSMTMKNYNLVKSILNKKDLTLNNIEAIQIQKYDTGQQYREHCDYFNYPGYAAIDNDRICTVIVYLNDDFEEGETKFPKLNLKIVPKKGSCLYFEYLYDTNTNHKTLHAGLPPVSGEKWIATSWVRDKPYSKFIRERN